jgi:hypothetical protein
MEESNALALDALKAQLKEASADALAAQKAHLEGVAATDLAEQKAELEAHALEVQKAALEQQLEAVPKEGSATMAATLTAQRDCLEATRAAAEVAAVRAR